MNDLMGSETVQRVGSSLRKELEATNLRRRPPTEPITIFRVPHAIRNIDPDAYEPNIISLGPYHRGNPRLQPMNKLKLHYARKILRRNPHLELEAYVAHIESRVSRARGCYAEDTDDIGTDDFVRMMLLDGCFIVELLLMLDDDEKMDDQENNDEDYTYPIITTPWSMSLVLFDMIKLENQIPFFVIQDIFNHVMSGGGGKSLVGLALRFFDFLFPSKEGKRQEEPASGVHHLLHLVHSRLEPAQRRKSGNNMSCRLRWGWCSTRASTTSDPEQPPVPKWVCSATELRQAGVKLWRNLTAESILDVSFKCRTSTLEIPQLLVHEETIPLFRNLVAFEQCCPKIAGSYVTEYSFFMDRMIDTPQDVALLHRKGVIINLLGSDELGALVFNKLCMGVCINYEESYLADLFRDLTRHCESRTNKWWADLMRKYFNNPWTFFSLLVALVLLVLTATQTGYAIQAYYHPKA